METLPNLRNKKAKMTLWKEIFNPSQFPQVVPTETEFDKAWQWAFSDMEKSPLILRITRSRSLNLRKSGIADKTAEIALWSLFNQFGASNAIPTRKTPPKSFKIPKRGR
jgi:hypothetical protein